MKEHNIKDELGNNTSVTIERANNVFTGKVDNVEIVINDGEAKMPKVKVNDLQAQVTIQQRQADILQYVSNLKEYVATNWEGKYENLWRKILDDFSVATEIYNPGRQQDTTFNRNLVANIICVMCEQHVLTEKNATKLTIALEGDKDKSVRGQFCSPSTIIEARVKKIIEENK